MTSIKFAPYAISIALLTFGCGSRDDRATDEKSIEPVFATLNVGSTRLNVGHKILEDRQAIEIMFQQSDNKFCVNKKTLFFNPALDLGNFNIRSSQLLEKGAMITLPQLLASNNVTSDIGLRSNFELLKEKSGSFFVDISSFYENKAHFNNMASKKYIGYLSVEFFLCSQIYGIGKQKNLIAPINYIIKIK
jgi:hypothetical protein